MMKKKQGIVRIAIAFITTICYVCPTALTNDITNAAFGGNINMQPAAFGDFNSDELTDIFMIRNEHAVEIWLGSSMEPFFKSSPEMRCEYPPEYKVTSVVPGDFDGDALMDILVTAKKGVGDVTYGFVAWGESDRLNCSAPNEDLKMKGEPLAIVHNRNMTVDFFGVDEKGDRVFWIFHADRNFTKVPFAKNNTKLPPLRNPHSHGFLEMNGDNSPDLYLTAETNYEIWFWNNENEMFVNNRNITFPPDVDVSKGLIGQTLFMDVELADKIDHLVPVCFDRECCKSAIFAYSNERWVNLNVNFTDGRGVNWGFFNDVTAKYADVITLRGGDFNMDGYPDILATLTEVGNSRAHAEHFGTFFLENVACVWNCSNFSRTFQVKWTTLHPMNEQTVMGAFYDFLQDGILDVIFVHKKGSSYNATAFKNTLDYDANFLKVMVITGLTNNNATLPERRWGSSGRTFGTNLPGPNINYKTTTQGGDEMRCGASTQLPQSAHMALYLPYTIFGFGRTPNFVEDLTVGMFNRTHTWTQIIPNSQLVVIPYPPNDPDKWRAQLFVTPSKIILQSVLTFLVICFILCIIIYLLYLKEKHEDELEQSSQGIHFDIM